MRRSIVLFMFLIALGTLFTSCEKSKQGKTTIPTAPIVTDDGPTGTITFKVSFAPWRNMLAKTAGVESIDKVTAYVYKPDDTEITNKDLTVASGRATGSITVTAQNDLKVVLVYLDDTTVRWIGEDTDVDTEAGKETTADIVEHFMGTSVSAPDTVLTGESYEISSMSRPYATGYQFQEATSPDFTGAITYDEADTTRTIDAKSEAGTLYYRARANTKYGYGPWYTTGDASTGIKTGKGTIVIDVPIPSDEPGTGKIAFASNRDGNSEIYVMDADGSNQTSLTNSEAYESYPSWSPDYYKIAYICETSSTSKLDIYVMNADGSNQTRLTYTETRENYPSWSPDGSQIAFDSERDGPGEIYVMDEDGSNQTRLTDTETRENNPSWSPDGYKIAFVSERDGPGEIYVMDADGSNQTNITNSPYEDVVPSWSPDGYKIAFASVRDGNWEIYVMDADGSNQTRLTNNSDIDYSPSWSPDGSQIAFDSLRDGNREIYIMDADGSNQTKLTNNSDEDIGPSWSPF